MTVTWKTFYSGQDVPGNLIKGGHESNGSPLYIARAHIQTEEGEDAGVHPGKYGEATGRGALIPYGGKEVYYGRYDLLVGDEDSVKWVDVQGVLNPEGLNLVEAGKHTDGQPIYIAQVEHEGALIPGKTATFMNGGTFSYSGHEINDNQTYKVLVHA